MNASSEPESTNPSAYEHLSRDELIEMLVERDQLDEQRASTALTSLSATTPPAAFVRGTFLGRAMTRLIGVVTPRLGRLEQHPPRPRRTIPVPRRKDAQPLPSIGIVTPSYQQGKFIAETIESVQAQGYPSLQHFVQDGGSTDETVDVLKGLSGQLTGWESVRDAGQGDAINRGFRHIDAEIMAYLNSDDLLLPGALAVVGEFFSRHPEIDVVYGDRLIIDENGLEVGDWRLPAHDDKVLSWADYIPQETLFWRQVAWERAGGTIDVSMKFAVDWDLILRMRDSGARFHHIPRYLGAFRVHVQSKTVTQVGTIGREDMDYLRRRSLGFVPTDTQISQAVRGYLTAHLLVDFLPRAIEKFKRRVFGQK